MSVVTKQFVIDRFNTLVRSNAHRIDSAVWYIGNHPRTISNGALGIPNVLGARAEVVHGANDIPGSMLASTIFNVLHSFAMELTRVRKTRSLYLQTTNGTTVIHNDGIQVTALQSEVALYFPIPGGQRDPGTPVDSSSLESFLTDLQTKVNDIRTNEGVYLYNMFSCHTSCHSSCHSSRSRR